MAEDRGGGMGVGVYITIVQYLDGVVEEGSVHGLSDHLHAPEGEGQVGQPSTHPGPRQGLLEVRTATRI